LAGEETVSPDFFLMGPISVSDNEPVAMLPQILLPITS
jgi:hypothetical protein